MCDQVGWAPLRCSGHLQTLPRPPVSLPAPAVAPPGASRLFLVALVDTRGRPTLAGPGPVEVDRWSRRALGSCLSMCPLPSASWRDLVTSFRDLSFAHTRSGPGDPLWRPIGPRHRRSRPRHATRGSGGPPHTWSRAFVTFPQPEAASRGGVIPRGSRHPVRVRGVSRPEGPRLPAGNRPASAARPAETIPHPGASACMAGSAQIRLDRAGPHSCSRPTGTGTGRG